MTTVTTVSVDPLIYQDYQGINYDSRRCSTLVTLFTWMLRWWLVTSNMGITFASMHGKFEIRLKSEIILILSWLYSLCTLGKGKNNIMAPCQKKEHSTFFSCAISKEHVITNSRMNIPLHRGGIAVENIWPRLQNDGALQWFATSNPNRSPWTSKRHREWTWRTNTEIPRPFPFRVFQLVATTCWFLCTCGQNRDGQLTHVLTPSSGATKPLPLMNGRSSGLVS